MSPVGNAFRTRCRMFPSLVNCCTIDWFTEWPREALLGVSKSFFESVQLGTDELKVSLFYLHLSDSRERVLTLVLLFGPRIWCKYFCDFQLAVSKEISVSCKTLFPNQCKMNKFNTLFGVLAVSTVFQLFNGDSSQIQVSWTICNQYLTSPLS